MNKITKLLAVLALAASTTLWSCKGDTGETGPKGDKGDTGAAGAAGINGTNGTNGKDGVDGKDGNANVESYSFTVKSTDWVKSPVAGIGNAATSDWGKYRFAHSAITAEKFVMVYVKSNDNYLVALPVNITTNMNGSVERLQFGYETGNLDLLYRLDTQLFGGEAVFAPNYDLNFEIVLTTKTVATAMKNGGVDLKNYNAVVNYLSAQ